MDKSQLKVYLTGKASQGWSAHICATIIEIYNVPGAFPVSGVSEQTIMSVYDYIYRHNSYGSINKTSTSNGNNVIDITYEDAFTMMWFMWLDGIHDDYLDINFPDFLESRKVLFDDMIMNDLKGRATSGMFSTDVKLVLGEFMKVDSGFATKYLTPATNGTRRQVGDRWVIGEEKGTKRVFTGNWESKFKSILKNLYGSQVREMNPATHRIESENAIYLTIDQEVSVSAPLSNIILTSRKISKSSSRNRDLDTTAIRPYITTGTLFDPGRLLVREALRPDILMMAANLSNHDDIGKLLSRSYFLGDLRLVFKLNDGKTFMKVESLVQRRDLTYGLKVNNQTVSLNLTKRTAGGTEANAITQTGKYFGDYLQLLYVLFFRRESPNAGRRRYLGTGDSNFAMEFWFYNRLFRGNRSPNAPLNLIIDGGQAFRNNVFIYNLPSDARIVRLDTRQNNNGRSGAGGSVSGMPIVGKKRGRNNNTENNATSGRPSPIPEQSNAPPPAQKPRVGNNVNNVIRAINNQGVLSGDSVKISLFKTWLNKNPEKKARFMSLKNSIGNDGKKLQLVSIIKRIGTKQKGRPYPWAAQLARSLA